MNIDYSMFYMDNSILDKFRVYSETRFRTPLRIERQIGLWVDRIGGGSLRKGIPADAWPRLRKLGQYAVVFIESGSGFFISPSTGKVEIAAGSVIVLFPDEPNVYYPKNNWCEKYIVWNGPDAVRLEKLGYISKDRMILDDESGIVSTTYEKLRNIISDEDKAAIFERKNIITDMILKLFRLSNPQVKEEQWHIKIASAIEWLTENYAQEISIAEFAKKHHISESHFRKHFKQRTGRSPREFVNSLRISKAKELLKQNLSVKEVAFAVGFKDMFYFMRLFKKAVGMSCGDFRIV